MKKYIFYITTLALIILTYACKKETTDTTSPLDGYTRLNEGYVIGASAKIEIWGLKNYFTGFNTLKFVVRDSLNLDEKITDAHIHLEPILTMDTAMSSVELSTPVENPLILTEKGVYTGAITFIMPTIANGNWVLGVEVHNHKYDLEGETSFDIVVSDPIPAVLKSFVSNSADSSKLFVSLLLPTQPVVGLNDIEFSIHTQENLMSFLSANNYTIEINPEMPGMGHSSSNNVNPVNIGSGHYKGKVNFTFTGDWRINVVIKKNGVAVSDGLYFDISL